MRRALIACLIVAAAAGASAQQVKERDGQAKAAFDNRAESAVPG
jgi:hypothetical protein